MCLYVFVYVCIMLRIDAQTYVDTHVHKCACRYVCKRRVLESTIST